MARSLLRARLRIFLGGDALVVVISTCYGTLSFKFNMHTLPVRKTLLYAFIDVDSLIIFSIFFQYTYLLGRRSCNCYSRGMISQSLAVFRL
jgi:hypothetical protein